MSEPVEHGACSLVMMLDTGALIIRHTSRDERLRHRTGRDGWRRTVAYVKSMDDWNRFVTALEAGASEADAVRAIDA